MFFLFFPIQLSNENSNLDYKNTNLATNNSNPDYNNTKKKKIEIKHKHRPIIQELKPITRTPKKRKKQIIISHSFIDEPKFSHSFPTRTTLSISRPKQHDHSKSRSTLIVSRPKQHNLQDKPQQNPARPSNSLDLKHTHSLSLTCLYKNSHPHFLPFLKHCF